MYQHISVPVSSRYLVEATLGKSLSSEYLSTIDKWVGGSGVEWTVKRLKYLLLAAKQLRAGNRSIVQEIYQKESIAYHPGTLYPKQRSLKVIFNTIQTAQTQSVLKRHFGILRIGTMFRLDTCSTTQIEDALKGITDPAKPSDWTARLSKSLEALAHRCYGDQRKSLKPLSLKRLKPFTSTYSVGKVEEELKQLPYGKAVYSLCTAAYIPDCLWEEMPEEIRDFLALVRSGGAEEGTTGKLSFLSEKGAKCRTVAVPNAWIQLLMEPVHAALDSLARQTHESAVHDQNKGAFFMKDHLARNERLWCFDLSSATDRFPRSLQCAVLRGLNLGIYAEALDEMCSYWEFHQGNEHDVVGHVDYSVGQPMGMYGSFPLFHITHHLLLKWLEGGIAKSEGRKLENSYLVLGDDVVISDPVLAKAYKMIMAELNVPISPTKSITSCSLGEFAGFLGVKTKDSVAIFRPFKHGIQGRDNGHLSLINALGCKTKKLPQKWGNWYDLYRHTLSWRNPDLSPLITENDKGGLPLDRIDRGTLNLLLYRVLTVLPDLETNLVYEFGSLDDWNWHQVVEDVTYALLDEKCTGVLSPEIVGIDFTKPDVPSLDPEALVMSDPLMHQASLRRSAEESVVVTEDSHSIVTCAYFNDETRMCTRVSEDDTPLKCRTCPAKDRSVT